ncbi:hypothetical protein LIER_42265 [Lithospermum erythrorhizon]|uniref:Uncharacterized protein n=1 Tax=Lithospermum erythrorhizon TaxID=34254 RepID=A0AAV3RMQ2_LITER
MDQDKYSDNVVKEIDKMFKEVAKRHPLALGLALAPCCKEYCLSCSCRRSLDNQIVVYINQHMNGLDEFIEEYKEFLGGHGGLTFSFSICLQSIQDENSNLLVLEFFLLPGCYWTECISLLSGSLLAMIKELVSGYNVADEDFPGEELFPETCDSLKHDEIDCIQVSHSALSFAVTLTCGCDSDDVEECFLDNDEAVVDFFLPAKLSYENEESFEDEESSDYPLVLWNHDAGKRHGVEELVSNLSLNVSR